MCKELPNDVKLVTWVALGKVHFSETSWDTDTIVSEFQDISSGIQYVSTLFQYISILVVMRSQVIKYTDYQGYFPPYPNIF